MTEMIKEQEKTEKLAKRLIKAERGIILLFLILLIVLTIKSIYLDEVKDLTLAEQQFKDFAEYSLDRDYDGILEKTTLLSYRVIGIKMADEGQKAVLRYEDPKTGEMTEVVQNGRHEAEVRGYILWIMPIRQFSVTAEIKE